MARLLVLEWSQGPEDIEVYERMLEDATDWACWFCWSDGMVPGFGLVDAAGLPTSSYSAFQAANEEDDMAEPNDEIKKTMQEFEEAGGTVGTVYAVDDLAHGQVASTDAGLFVWRDGIPGAQILLDARAKNPFR